MKRTETLVWLLYDISKDKSRNKVAKRCLEAGLYRVQLSVFLGTIERNRLDGAINAIQDMERELRRTREKAEAGAEFIITQPVFSVEPMFEFLDAVADLKVPVIAGIWPLASYRNAEFMRNEVPGVVVPDWIMERMERRETKEDQRAEGISIARETLDRLRDRVAGVQVSAPFGNVETALAVME
jgi:homocysteine S-methyltransferase